MPVETVTNCWSGNSLVNQKIFESCLDLCKTFGLSQFFVPQRLNKLEHQQLKSFVILFFQTLNRMIPDYLELLQNLLVECVCYPHMSVNVVQAEKSR
jgi:hypothetical protein